MIPDLRVDFMTGRSNRLIFQPNPMLKMSQVIMHNGKLWLEKNGRVVSFKLL